MVGGGRLLSQGEVESEIMRLSEVLEEETHRHADLCELEAESEIAFKKRHDTLTIHEANRDALQERKVLAAERSARVNLASADEFAVMRINQARRTASKETLVSVRQQIDALRTLAANIRSQT